MHPDGGSDLVANTNAGYKNQCRNDNGKQPFNGGRSHSLEEMLNSPCPKHSYPHKPTKHAWKDCHLLREIKNHMFQEHPNDGNGPPGGSGSGGFLGSGFNGGSSNSVYQNQGHQ